MKIYDGVEKNAQLNGNKTALIYGQKKLSYEELKVNSDLLAEELNRIFPNNSVLNFQAKDPLNSIVFLIAASKAGMRVVLTDDSYPDEYLKDSLKTSFYNKDNNVFLGILSSGSTNNPKLIWRSHESWCKAFPFQRECFKISGKDTLFLAGSLIYSANLNSSLHMLNEGGSVVFSSSKFPKTWLEEINKNNVTTIFMVPANYRILLKTMKENISQVRVLISAGEKMDKKTFCELLEIFEDPDFFEYYGAAEMGHISWIGKEEFIEKPQSVGKAFPGVKITIKNNRIWVSSPFAASGFESESTIKDLGYFDKEGFLFLTGREGNVINKGGIKIIPQDIEKIIKEIPGVEDSLVIGQEDSLKGQIVVSFVETKNPEINRLQIKKYLKDKVPNGAIPQRIYFLNIFPRNKSGKIDFKILKNMI